MNYDYGKLVFPHSVFGVQPKDRFADSYYHQKSNRNAHHHEGDHVRTLDILAGHGGEVQRWQ